MATRPVRRGVAELVDQGVALLLDLDWQDPAAHADDALPTEGEVRQRLARFPHPPSVLVCSGHGLQPAWLLDAPVPTARGAELILRLHQALEDHGLPTDRADRASLLRVPGSWNHKTPTPELVSIQAADLTLGDTPEWLDTRLPKTAIRAGNERR